jgi:ribosomal protein S27AE
MDIFGLAGIFVVIIIPVVMFFQWIDKTTFGSERWCAQCNTWNIMKLVGDKYKCKKCGHLNQENRGCPKCGWYARYEKRYVGRVGPYSEPVEAGSYLLTFHETWNCPQHGNYVCSVPASESRYIFGFNNPYDGYSRKD